MNIKELESLVLKAIALVGINGLAFCFDAEYIPMAVAVDALMLGVEIKGRLNK